MKYNLEQNRIVDEEIMPWVIEQIQSNPSIRICLIIPETGWFRDDNLRNVHHKKTRIAKQIKRTVIETYLKVIKDKIRIYSEEQSAPFNRFLNALNNHHKSSKERKALYSELRNITQIENEFNLPSAGNKIGYTFGIYSESEKLYGTRWDVIISMVGHTEHIPYILVENGTFINKQIGERHEKVIEV